MSESQTDPAAPKRIKVHYIKSRFFRVIYTDGFFVGPSPSGGVHVAAFNQRAAIPQESTHDVGPDDNLGAEVLADRIGKTGLVREVEAEVVMNLDSAKKLVEALKTAIGVIESAGRPKPDEKQND